MNAPRQTPSWLALERYALGELPDAQREQLEAQLIDDALARDCLAQIRSDVRTMPPLPALKTPEKQQKQTWYSQWRLTGVLVAMASLALLLLLPKLEGESGMLRVEQHEGLKGDGVAISLVREHAGSVALEPLRFTLEDRFKVRVTCGATDPRVADVVVYQAGEASFPLQPQTIRCGNHVVLDGAFRFDALSPARVCVVLSKTPQSRALLQTTAPSGENVDCTALNAAEP